MPELRLSAWIPPFRHMKEKEDVEDFFAAFEIHMGNHNVVQSAHSVQLLPAAL